jgi:phosphoadenosine phosphosulfate reductase
MTALVDVDTVEQEAAVDAAELAAFHEPFVRRAAMALDGAPAEEILRWALDRWHPSLVIASSMGDTVLVDMAAKIRPGVPVMFVDTGYHFAETIGTRDAVAWRYDVKLLSITPKRTVAEQDAEFGPKLYERNPDLCCAMRKVRPLDDALRPYAAWASGARRSETTSRSGMGVVEWDGKRGLVKVNPLANWTDEQVEAYIEEHDLLVNPLLRDGYPSIGCAPCTRRVAPGEDPRSGRWAGTSKIECGLHV